MIEQLWPINARPSFFCTSRVISNQIAPALIHTKDDDPALPLLIQAEETLDYFNANSQYHLIPNF
jgi:hypothetical protein